MPDSALLSRQAIQLFERQWPRQCVQLGIGSEHLGCSLHYLMPELLRLAREFGDGPSLQQMRPLVRRRVQDLDAIYLTQIHDDSTLVLDRYVDTLLTAIEQVRNDARSQGLWLGADAASSPAPLMCG